MISDTTMAIDFRKTSSLAAPTMIEGSLVESVDCYKYLGTVLDGNLKFDLNTTAICKKGLQRLYFLRRLGTFNVDKTLMVLFYRLHSLSLFELFALSAGMVISQCKTVNSLSCIVKHTQ